MPGDGPAGQAVRMKRIKVGTQFLGRGDLRACAFGRQPGFETLQIAPVCVNRVRGQTLLDPAEIEKGLYPHGQSNRVDHRNQ